ncbi:MAG: hypothetical protein FWD04_11420 [Conexibacteraceae bacterium]|nr:hypothetical protein [Conexibacteraceae bacterium]
MIAFKYLDVLFVVIGAIVALILGAPSLGVTLGAAGWIVQRALQAYDRRLTARIEDSLRRAGIRSAEAFGRIWLLAGAIILAAVIGGRKDGLAAAVTIFATYSVAFAMRVKSGPPPERSLDGR